MNQHYQSFKELKLNQNIISQIDQIEKFLNINTQEINSK